MTDLLGRGINFFNKRRYFDAHECWEDLWRDAEGDLRHYYQGLVQVAVGLHHMEKGNLAGGRRVLERGLGKLEKQPAVYCGIDNALLINLLRRTLASGNTVQVEIRTGVRPDLQRGNRSSGAE